MTQTLRQWLEYGWVTAQRASRRDIADLLAIADRDVRNAELEGLSPDWRMSIAYNAALQAAMAALAAAGYRAEKTSHHYRVIQSLELTIGLDPGQVDVLDAFRKKRTISQYDRAGTVSEREANEMLALARLIRQAVTDWLRQHYPDLLSTE